MSYLMRGSRLVTRSVYQTEQKFHKFRDVAQSGSALPWGGRGRKFKSCRSEIFCWLASSRFVIFYGFHLENLLTRPVKLRLIFRLVCRANLVVPKFFTNSQKKWTRLHLGNNTDFAKLILLLQNLLFCTRHSKQQVARMSCRSEIFTG